MIDVLKIYCGHPDRIRDRYVLDSHTPVFMVLCADCLKMALTAHLILMPAGRVDG